ncbi:MAG: extracellular solute-binding protein [Geminicoccaceae bacterium]|nr:extracellular solute-binding protein [Geminicoccaceae bacterium]
MTSKPFLAVAATAALSWGTATLAQQRTLVVNTDTSDPAPKQAIQEPIDGFKALHPDIDVTWNVFDHEGYKTSIRNFLTADPPDVAAWYAGNRMAPYVEAGLFEPVDDVWQENGLDEQMASAASAMTLDGRKWGAPTPSTSGASTRGRTC